MKNLGSVIVLVLFVAFAALALVPTKLSGAIAERRRRASPLETLDRDAMLWAIRQVESGDNPAKPGPGGERSAYQFTAATWHNYTRAPFRVATTNRQAADLIAARHLQHVLNRLHARGLPILPEFIAAAWHYGPERAHLCATGDAEIRAGNLYREAAR